MQIGGAVASKFRELWDRDRASDCPTVNFCFKSNVWPDSRFYSVSANRSTNNSVAVRGVYSILIVLNSVFPFFIETMTLAVISGSGTACDTVSASLALYIRECFQTDYPIGAIDSDLDYYGIRLRSFKMFFRNRVLNVDKSEINCCCLSGKVMAIGYM